MTDQELDEMEARDSQCYSYRGSLSFSQWDGAAAICDRSALLTEVRSTRAELNRFESMMLDPGDMDFDLASRQELVDEVRRLRCKIQLERGNDDPWCEPCYERGVKYGSDSIRSQIVSYVKNLAQLISRSSHFQGGFAIFESNLLDAIHGFHATTDAEDGANS